MGILGDILDAITPDFGFDGNIIEKRGSFTYNGSEYIESIGSAGNDTQISSLKGDTLNGNDGDDYLQGNAGNDYLAGGNGNDTLSGGEDNDSLFGGIGDDTLVGDNGDDYLAGDNGDDYLAGGEGNDTLDGEYGNDLLGGGNGYDIASYLGQFNTFSTAFNADGSVQITGGEGTDLLYGIERINFGNGGFYNVYTGDAGANGLTADANVFSLLYGGNGNDTLRGGNYNDTLAGGNGNDILDGSSGYDIASYFGQYTDYKAAFTSDGAVQITGSEGTDLLYRIDQINFGNGGFYNVYTGDAGANSLTADANVFSLLYGDNGNDTLIGGNYNDTLNGGNGNDSLNGGGGNDYINGYGSTVTNDSQYDRLTGGTGSDTFVLGEKDKVFYNETGDGYAVIQDWTSISGGFYVEFDRVQLAGNASQYKVEFSSVGGIGSNAQDTEIFYRSNNSWERIGIIQDAKNFNLSRNAVFV